MTALSMAARQAPFLPLLHGLIAALEMRLDDTKLGTYVRSLPVASAGVSRLLSCDAATARWPARAVRIAATAAIAAAHDVARASIPLTVGSSSCVSLSGVSLTLSALQDVKGIRVKVNITQGGAHKEDGKDEKSLEKWSFFRIGIRSAELMCECGTIVNGGGDLVLENSEDVASNSGVVRFDNSDVDRWLFGHEEEDCGQILLSIEVELLRGNATVFAKRDEKEREVRKGESLI